VFGSAIGRRELSVLAGNLVPADALPCDDAVWRQRVVAKHLSRARLSLSAHLGGLEREFDILSRVRGDARPVAGVEFLEVRVDGVQHALDTLD
jgi:hypothetical protein